MQASLGKEDKFFTLRSKIYNLLLLAPAALFVLIVRVLRPFILIRFGFIDSTRIGQFAANPELYLCRKGLGLLDKKAFDIFYCLYPVANLQLKKMWQRVLNITPYWRFFGLASRLNRLLPAGAAHAAPLGIESRDVWGCYAKMPAHLSFTAQEEALGKEGLRKIGIPENAQFICFHVRDSAYLKSLRPGFDWSYHQYRDCSKENYLQALEALAGKGYYLLRMGAAVEGPLNTKNPRIVDYAAKFRTDFMDIYLSAKCRFFIACGSGIDEVPAIFRRPVVYVNFIPLEYVHTWSPVLLTIPKKLFSRREKRLLKFSEILDSSVGRFFYARDYEQNGLEVIENTAEEITAVSLETEARLRGCWQAQAEDEKLQQRFWSLLKPGPLHGAVNSRIGAEFLRQNRELLN